MPKEETDVLISGSGVSGLYAALSLSRLGLKVQVVERHPPHLMQDGFVLLSPRSLHLLEKFNLLSSILEIGTKHWKLDIHQNGSFDITMRLWENEISKHNYVVSCNESDFRELLWKHLETEYNVKVRYNQEILDLNLYNNRYTFQQDNILTQFKDKETHEPLSVTSKYLIAADGTHSSIRQKLGVCFMNHNPNKFMSRVFYTLKINVISTDFPSDKQLSCIYKKPNLIYILGQDKKMIIVIEQQPNWSKRSVDEDVPLPVTLDYIKYMIEPYKIEFGKVMSYTRREGCDYLTTETFTVESKFFFVGGAAQKIHPAGVFDVNVDLSQIELMGWKLALNLTRSLEDTLDTEPRSIVTDVIQSSFAFSNVIGQHFQQDISPIMDLLYQASRLRPSFSGQVNLSINVLNQPDETIDWIGPASDLIGTLAPNAKLKPYRLVDLVRSGQVGHGKRPSLGWKGIKPNYSDWLDRLRMLEPTGLGFVLMVLGGKLEEMSGPFWVRLKGEVRYRERYRVGCVTSSSRAEAIHFLNLNRQEDSFAGCGLESVFLDHDQQCYKAYGVVRPEVVVIRPDGFIGTRILIDDTRAFQQLIRYFDSIFN